MQDISAEKHICYPGEFIGQFLYPVNVNQTEAGQLQLLIKKEICETIYNKKGVISLLLSIKYCHDYLFHLFVLFVFLILIF